MRIRFYSSTRWAMSLLTSAGMVGLAGPAGAAPRTLPYDAVPDARVVLAAPPAAGSAAQQEDDHVFRMTRALKDTPRWALATQDADLTPTHLVADFSCAVGHTLDLKKAPSLQALMALLEPVTSAHTAEVKAYWHRQRPFVGTNLPICTSPDGLGLHASYPSGHTTTGFGLALLLARLLPEHATAILQRGRVFGESRVVCGVHWKSDVEAGYLNAASQMATLLAHPAIQDDLLAAQKELKAQLATAEDAPDPALCRVEKDAASHSVLSAP